MNIQVSDNGDRLVLWVAVVFLLACFGAGDVAVVAWSAAAATFGQLAASAVALISIGLGLLFTIWQIRRPA